MGLGGGLLGRVTVGLRSETTVAVGPELITVGVGVSLEAAQPVRRPTPTIVKRIVVQDDALKRGIFSPDLGVDCLVDCLVKGDCFIGPAFPNMPKQICFVPFLKQTPYSKGEVGGDFLSADKAAEKGYLSLAFASVL